MLPLRAIWRYFWLVIKRYKVAFFSLFFFATGRIIFSSIATGYIYKNIIDTLNNNILSIDDRYHLILFLLIPLCVSFLTSMFMTRYGDYVKFRFVSRAIKDLYDMSFVKLSHHSYNFYTNNFSGSLVAKVKRFARSFDNITDIAVINFWVIIVVITSSTIALWFQSKILGEYFLIWCTVYCILVAFFVKQKIKIDIRKAEADSKLTAVLSDSITNMMNIKIFSAFQKEFTYFQEVTTLLKNRISAAFKFTIIRSAFQATLMVSFHIFVLYTMVGLWRSGQISVGVFVMTYIYFNSIIDRLWDLSQALTNFMESMTDAKEMVDIFEKIPDILDPINPEIPKIHEANIIFSDLSFGYIDNHEVFTNFNLDIKSGEKVGLVGHSGSGKSTITKLLLRFAEVGKGEILIDGQNIAHITQDDLRNTISYVPQEPILFHRTIKENISYSKSDATEEEIIDAAKKAHAHEFISTLQYGYDTLVGERGVKLSGGERQRVAIARAMLKNSPILVLDEATSSLDSISETYIQEAFNELMKGKTTIVIAHRLSTIQKMDRIIVLEKGAIVEDGTHRQLLKKKGVYADLWAHQSGGFIE